MALILSDSENYKSIANAIRTKLSTNRVYKPSEMDEAVMKMGLHGSMSTDPTLKDVFNHGSIVGINPVYAIGTYDYDKSKYPAIDTQYPYSPQGQAVTYFKIATEGGTQIMKSVSGRERSESDARTVLQGIFVFNLQYSKICFDCEVVNGEENKKNTSFIYAMKGEYKTDDYCDRIYLTNGNTSPKRYNMERQVVKFQVPTNEVIKYYIGFANTLNTINIYSIWLEP